MKSFLAVVDNYKSDDNHFDRGGIDPLIHAIDENQADKYLQQLADYEHEENMPDGLDRVWINCP